MDLKKEREDLEKTWKAKQKLAEKKKEKLYDENRSLCDDLSRLRKQEKVLENVKELNRIEQLEKTKKLENNIELLKFWENFSEKPEKYKQHKQWKEGTSIVGMFNRIKQVESLNN